MCIGACCVALKLACKRVAVLRFEGVTCVRIAAKVSANTVVVARSQISDLRAKDSDAVDRSWVTLAVRGKSTGKSACIPIAVFSRFRARTKANPEPRLKDQRMIHRRSESGTVDPVPQYPLDLQIEVLVALSYLRGVFGGACDAGSTWRIGVFLYVPPRWVVNMERPEFRHFRKLMIVLRYSSLKGHEVQDHTQHGSCLTSTHSALIADPV